MIEHIEVVYGTLTKKKWIPDSAILVGDFELGDYRKYMIVNQNELDEINKIKEETQIKKDSEKYNL